MRMYFSLGMTETRVSITQFSEKDLNATSNNLNNIPNHKIEIAKNKGRCVLFYARIVNDKDRQEAMKLKMIHLKCLYRNNKFMGLNCYNKKYAIRQRGNGLIL